MQCNNCGVIIPAERLEILPHTKTCVKCSQESTKCAMPVWEDGVNTLEMVDEVEDQIFMGARF